MQRAGLLYDADQQAMRTALGWVQQGDTHNCGPLATAAALSILKGLRPCAATLGLREEVYDCAGGALLRDCITMFLLDGEHIGDETEAGLKALWVGDEGMEAERRSWIDAADQLSQHLRLGGQAMAV